jgi:uncharacterized protein (DUF1810 family)
MNKIKTRVLYLMLVILSITFISCKNNSSGGNVDDVVVRNTDSSKSSPSVVGELQRFYSAQTSLQLSTVESELLNGKKTSHWIWYIFPQIDGLVVNPSPTNRYYSIKTRQEAIAYLEDGFLSNNLKKHVALVRRHSKTKTLRQIFAEDARKFVSSMTLFAQIAQEESCFSGQENVFWGALIDFGERKDVNTLSLMQQDFFNK